MSDEPLLSKIDLSTYLGIPVKTLTEWRYAGTGPQGYKVGRHVRYVRAEVDEWLHRQIEASA